ncbi:hypothetical protein T02_436 [Trichinella nativa]|uniref:Uncharacterized protein n=1 Tax=Trichinella nativa TaxID=6335 RepID=A0A0V1KU01_9BILA|nr:hypothetical protein T02_436 [Trichinella nativa]
MLKNLNNFNNVVGNGSWNGYLCQSGVAEVPASAFRIVRLCDAISALKQSRQLCKFALSLSMRRVS